MSLKDDLELRRQQLKQMLKQSAQKRLKRTLSMQDRLRAEGKADVASERRPRHAAHRWMRAANFKTVMHSRAYRARMEQEKHMRGMTEEKAEELLREIRKRHRRESEGSKQPPSPKQSDTPTPNLERRRRRRRAQCASRKLRKAALEEAAKQKLQEGGAPKKRKKAPVPKEEESVSPHRRSDDEDLSPWQQWLLHFHALEGHGEPGEEQAGGGQASYPADFQKKNVFRISWVKYSNAPN